MRVHIKKVIKKILLFGGVVTTIIINSGTTGNSGNNDPGEDPVPDIIEFVDNSYNDGFSYENKTAFDSFKQA